MCIYTRVRTVFCIKFRPDIRVNPQHQLNYAWNLLHDKHESKLLYRVRSSSSTHFFNEKQQDSIDNGKNIHIYVYCNIKLNTNETRIKWKFASSVSRTLWWSTLTKTKNMFPYSIGMKM